MRKAPGILLLLTLSSPLIAKGLSTQGNKKSNRINNNLIQIVGLPGGGTQSLPTNYVQNHIRRWKLLENTDQDRIIVKDSCQQSNVHLQIRWTPTLQFRPVLDFLIKAGIPSYVMAGLELWDSGNSDINDETIIMQSTPLARPLARQWTSIQFAVEPNFRMEVFQYEFLLYDDNDSKTDGTSPFQNIASWTLGDHETPARLIQKAMESFALVTSDLSNDSELLEGFNIVSVPLEVDWLSVPQPHQSGYTVACLITAEPDAQQVLTLDQDLLEMTASSMLELTILATKQDVGGNDESFG